MKRILIGGSPCTHWSIAQKNNRETEPEGLGWELFKNYLIAKEKFKPDFFLYENNKSAAQPIKDQIAKELGVELQYINSALVSAQNRQRFYAHNIPNVPQPEDRGILLKDILESGIGITVAKQGNVIKNERNKSNALLARDYKGFGNQEMTGVIEPVCVAQRGRYTDSGNRTVKGNGPIEQFYEAREDGKTNALTTVQKDNAVAEPVAVDLQVVGRKRNSNGAFERSWEARTDGKSSALTTVESRRMVAEPVRVGCYPSPDGTLKNSQGMRLYSIDGKSVNITAQGGGMGAKTGLYAIPVVFVEGVPKKAISLADGKEYPVYEVRNGLITIKDKQYPIKLVDGFYIIRKLTVTECCRLQTMPDDYCRAVSATQGYKGLGNGWTAEVIIHILKHMNIPLDEEIEILSMYDGIGTGRYCFDKMGYKNIKYYAYEIDKYPIQVAMSNYDDIIQCGDAFQVRNEDWKGDDKL